MEMWGLFEGEDNRAAEAQALKAQGAVEKKRLPVADTIKERRDVIYPLQNGEAAQARPAVCGNRESPDDLASHTSRRNGMDKFHDMGAR